MYTLEQVAQIVVLIASFFTGIYIGLRLLDTHEDSHV